MGGPGEAEALRIKQSHESFRPRIEGFLRTLCRDDDLAAELCQETFVRAFQYRASFDAMLTGTFYMLSRARAMDARRNLAHAYQIGDAYELALTTQPGRQIFAPAALMAFPIHAQEQSYTQCGVTSIAHIAVGTVHACRVVKQSAQVRDNAAILFAVLYTWNVLDALLSRSGTEVSIGGVESGSFGISATTRF